MKQLAIFAVRRGLSLNPHVPYLHKGASIGNGTNTASRELSLNFREQHLRTGASVENHVSKGGELSR